jgi:hypothetical protein
VQGRLDHEYRDLAGKEEVIYVFRHLRGAKPEYREVRTDTGQTGLRHPLATYLTADRLNALFKQ